MNPKHYAIAATSRNGNSKSSTKSVRCKDDNAQARCARLSLAGISATTRDMRAPTDSTDRAEAVINSSLPRRRIKKDQTTISGRMLRQTGNSTTSNFRQTTKVKSSIRIQSLFSPIQYTSARKHEYTNEPIPIIPAPWTKLNPPKPAIEHNIFANEDLEDGEVIELHKLTPSPILPKIDEIVPPQVSACKRLQAYISEVKTAYFDAKNKRLQWESLRDNFKSVNFQALVNDYLADCQMRRDRGEITDLEFERHSSMVMALLFGKQIEAEKDFLQAEHDLQECYDLLNRLRAETLETGRYGITDSTFFPLLRRSIEPEMSDSSPSDQSCESDLDKHREKSPDPVHNVWYHESADSRKDTRPVLTSDARDENMTNHHLTSNDKFASPVVSGVSDRIEDVDGFLLIKSYQDRLRVSRALDQRVPFTRRHFNGKLTTFNEARATDTRGDSKMDRELLRSADPVIHHDIRLDDEHEETVILVGNKQFKLSADSESLNGNCDRNAAVRGFIRQCINEDQAYQAKLKQVSKLTEQELTKSRPKNEKNFEQSRHILFGYYPSAGRKKFSDEEEIMSDDTDFFCGDTRMIRKNGIRERKLKAMS